MNSLNPTKNKHLTLDNRLEIQECLDNALSFKSIAQRISKEVKKHLFIKNTNVNRLFDSNNVPHEKMCPHQLCSPYVCNGCRKRHHYCGFQKQFYNAKKAHNEYTTLLSEAR